MKTVTIYTDGACSGNPGPGGYGAILIFDGIEKELAGFEESTTNNRMEQTAVIEALSALKEKCHVELFTDSTYVANAFLNGWIFDWERKNWMSGRELRVNSDLWQKLLELSRKHDISWHVVKGHSDNENNNRCDRLAVAQYTPYLKEKKKAEADKIAQSDEILVDCEDLIERSVGKKEVFKGRVFTVEVHDVDLPDGRKTTREVVRHSGGAAAVAIDDDGFVYLVEQYRFASGLVTAEIPAGKTEEGESPEICAKRELEEETGLKCETLELLTSYYSTPGYCSEKIYIYLAKGLSKGNVHRDAEEFIHVKKVHIDRAVELIREGKISDGKTVAGILLAKR